MMYVFLNDKIVPENRALVPVTDRGFLYGDGVFETMRSYGGEVFLYERHLRRLWRSAGLLGIEIPVDEERLMEAVGKTLEANGLEDSTIRVTVTRGSGPRGIDPTLECTPTLVIMVWPFKAFPAEIHRKGVDAIIALTRKTPASSLDPFVKSCNYLNNITSRGEAARLGAFEALMLNQDGYLAEGTVSNVFFVRRGDLYTPSLSCGILDGITREHVISLARGLGLSVREGMFEPQDTYDADEVFLTSTTSEVLPVGHLDSASYKVGPVTKKLMEAYRESTP